MLTGEGGAAVEFWSSFGMRGGDAEEEGVVG